MHIVSFQALEESKQDTSPVKEIGHMTEEEQIEYALALSRGECVDLPSSDANGNHKLTETDANRHTDWLNGANGKEVVLWNGFNQTDSNGLSHADEQHGEYEPMGEELMQSNQQGECAQLGKEHENEQRLPENSRTGEGEPSHENGNTHVNGYQPPFVSRTVQVSENQWRSRPASPSGSDPVISEHAHMNGDSGIASPDLDWHQENGDVSKDGEIPAGESLTKETKDDSAIELDLNKENQTPPPTIPPKKSKLDYSKVIDLCNDNGTDQSGGGVDDAGTNELSYAELKAKEEEAINRAMELSLQGRPIMEA